MHLSFLLFAACETPAASPIDETTVEATVSETIGTVVNVSWAAAGVDEVGIEYGPDTAYGYTTPTQAAAGDNHAVTVIGVPAGETWHYRPYVTMSGTRYEGQDRTVEAGEPAEDVREIQVLVDEDEWDGLTLAAVSGATAPADAVVRNADGQLVWYYHVADGQVFHAKRTLDGQAIIFNVDDQSEWDSRRAVRVSMDGTEVVETPTPWGHHDFELVPGIQFAYIAADFVEYEGETLVGDKIVEVLEDGSTRDVWTAIDGLEVTEHVGWDYDYYQEGRDWTHANGLAYDEADDAYYLSLYWLKQVVKIDRATGETIWVLGDGGDFTIPAGDEFGPQHSPVIVDGELLMFDNGGGSSEASRLARYSVDESAMTATLTWSWSRDDTSVTTQGGVWPLADGGVLSAWGETGTILATNAAGDVVWEVDHEPPTVVGRLEALESLYPD